MTENLSSSPLFAGRYHFEPPEPNWDTGRSGFVNIAFDLQERRLGVIKRAEVNSRKALSDLKNEVSALLKLRGLGVPDVYDVREAEYQSKTYYFVFMEYIQDLRVEENLSSLTALERAEIVSQLISLMTTAHRRGIVNGDIDLKHLFWRKKGEQLFVIDWGNSKLNVNFKNRNEFSYDLARTAEIIYSLVVGTPPPATGLVALPDDSKLTPGLAPVPIEFRRICQWAPRTPMPNLIAPYTTGELLEIALRWKTAVNRNKRYIPIQKLGFRGTFWLSMFIGLIIITTAVLFTVPKRIIGFETPTAPSTMSNTSSAILINLTETETSQVTSTPTLGESISPTQTLISSQNTTPSPKTHFPILIFDNQTGLGLNGCWVNGANESLVLIGSEGFSRRDDGFWSFRTGESREISTQFQTDFSRCLNGEQISAISMNVWVLAIEEHREFGFFLEDTNGNRREYTIWLERVGQSDKMYLRLRESNTITDYELVITRDLATVDAFPRIYYRFSLLVFLEINNDGLDILYINGSSLQRAVEADEIDPNQLIRAENVTRLSMGDVKAIGLVGYGGEIETVIWPLVFLGSEQIER